MQRALTMRQMLESSARMSRYMHYTISEKKQSIWIAQREGRAKDSNDRTQDSVLKMLAMGGEGDLIDRLMEMNIAPLAISYEYDPCDFLKAQEFQLKRDIEGYKKTTQDDLISMQTGLSDTKGKCIFRPLPVSMTGWRSWTVRYRSRNCSPVYLPASTRGFIVTIGSIRAITLPMTC